MTDKLKSRRTHRYTNPSGTADIAPTRTHAPSFAAATQPLVTRLLLPLVLLCISAAPALAQIVPDGRYWQYNHRRVLLLGGFNHGHNPFIDHDTDNDKDNQGVSTPEQIRHEMDELAAAGGNYLRCVLDPGMAAGIQGFDFCSRSSGRYDLATMTGPFWTRIEMFISEAAKRDIIVQLELWDRFDLIDGSWSSWPVSPWNPKNNINYTAQTSGLAQSYGSYNRHPFLQCIPGHPEYEKASASKKAQYDLIRSFQDKFVDKLLSITLKYDNVLYCMNNETHADPAWGLYWMNFIESRRAGTALGKVVATTDMFDDVFAAEKSRGLTYQLANRDKYDYIDISQANSRHADQEHWDAVKWIAEAAAKVDPPYLMHMTKVYGNDLALDGQPWSRFKPGDSDNAIEEWWGNLIAGVAGVRFHRPTSGIGLYPEAKSCISATRKIESIVKFWDVKDRLDLLTDRQPDDAYLAADPGKAYILYFTKNGQGSVGLKLEDYPNATLELRWVNITTGNWGPTITIQGNTTAEITRPDNKAHWAAAIIKK